MACPWTACWSLSPKDFGKTPALGFRFPIGLSCIWFDLTLRTIIDKARENSRFSSMIFLLFPWCFSLCWVPGLQELLESLALGSWREQFEPLHVARVPSSLSQDRMLGPCDGSWWSGYLMALNSEFQGRNMEQLQETFRVWMVGEAAMLSFDQKKSFASTVRRVAPKALGWIHVWESLIASKGVDIYIYMYVM